MRRDDEGLGIRPLEAVRTSPGAEQIDPIEHERRREERVPTEILARVRRLDPMSWHPGVCIDLSTGGLALHTTQSLNVGELIELELLGPDGPTSFCGRVVYRSLHRYGIALLGDGVAQAGADQADSSPR